MFLNAILKFIVLIFRIYKDDIYDFLNCKNCSAKCGRRQFRKIYLSKIYLADNLALVRLIQVEVSLKEKCIFFVNFWYYESYKGQVQGMFGNENLFDE